MTIYQAITNKTEEEVVEHFKGKQYSQLKEELAEIVVTFIKPVQEKFQQLMSSPEELDEILSVGAECANLQAQKTLEEVKKKVGLG